MKKIALLLLTLCTSFIFGLSVPQLKARVNDYGNVLSNSQERELENLLVSMEKGTSSQIAVLTVKSLEGDNLEEFSIRTVEKWGLGQKGSDNGVLLLVSMAEKKIRIEVGYGLESVLTDAKASYIIRNVISPNFKNGDIYKGLSDGVKAISGTISGEFKITNNDLTRDREENKSGGAPISFIFIILFLIFSSIGRRGIGGRRRGSGIGTFLILNSLLGSGSRRSGGFGGGGFSSGSGFGGGGFSGGGGSFGGGGSSGGW